MAEKRVTRLRKDIPALSLLVYPTAMIEVGGGLVRLAQRQRQRQHRERTVLMPA